MIFMKCSFFFLVAHRVGWLPTPGWSWLGWLPTELELVTHRVGVGWVGYPPELVGLVGWYM